MDEVKLDYKRKSRIGVGEAILCGGKSTRQITDILEKAIANNSAFLLTRLKPDQHNELPEILQNQIDYDPVSATAFLGGETDIEKRGTVAIITAGTIDVPVAREAARTLEFNGYSPHLIFDIGVSGIWRLMERVDEIATFDVVIVVAGMDAALPSVIGGLIAAPIIAVPTSAGYGAARDGETALAACLVSCAPGISVVNIDNGYGAAVATIRILSRYQE